MAAPGAPGVEVSNSLCCVESRSQCLVVSLQCPWMAEARLRLVQAAHSSKVLLGQRWSLFLLAAGLVLLKPGSSLPGFGAADGSNQFGFAVELFWTSPKLLGWGLFSPCPKAEQLQTPGRCPWKTPARWNSRFGSVKNARPNIPGSGSRWNSVPKGGSPACVRALQGPVQPGL